MDLNSIDEKQWCGIRGAGSEKTPEENMSLAAEIFVEHDHFDEEAGVCHADGIMLNRHLWRERRIEAPALIGPDYPGEDEVSTGAYLSLAAHEKGDDGLGGELAGNKTEQGQEPNQNDSAHKREYVFLQQHVEQAFAAYRNSNSAWPSCELSDWQKIEALARYASQWKMRTASVYASFHPVDVLFHSSYCTGAANILHALAMVAGFDSRFIAITYHSMVEINVNGRWIWADNIVGNGGITPNTFNYAELTSDPHAMVSFNDRQRKAYDSATARYRSPYALAGRFYWHFMSGEAKGRGIRSDVADGYGLTVAYDPGTACALYPELKQHRFFSPKGWAPTVNISEKGALVRSEFKLTPETALRKVFYISHCEDNPIKRAVVKVRLAEACDPQDLQCSIDGAQINCHGIGRRFDEPTADFIIDAALLGEGQHELLLTCVKNSVTCILYPDPLQPYFKPHYGSDLKLEDSSFSVEPCIPHEKLAALEETLLSEPLSV